VRFLDSAGTERPQQSSIFHFPSACARHQRATTTKHEHLLSTSASWCPFSPIGKQPRLHRKSSTVSQQPPRTAFRPPAPTALLHILVSGRHRRVARTIGLLRRRRQLQRRLEISKPDERRVSGTNSNRVAITRWLIGNRFVAGGGCHQLLQQQQQVAAKDGVQKTCTRDVLTRVSCPLADSLRVMRLAQRNMD